MTPGGVQTAESRVCVEKTSVLVGILRRMDLCEGVKAP